MENVDTLPPIITLHRIDGTSEIKYTMGYSGFSMQYSRCRSCDYPISKCTAVCIPVEERIAERKKINPTPNAKPNTRDPNTKPARDPNTSESGFGNL